MIGGIKIFNEYSIDSKYLALSSWCNSKNQLDQYLASNIDINAAMGTSALKAQNYQYNSSYISYKEIKGDYIFRWLYYY